MSRFLAHWVNLDPTIHAAEEGDAWISSDQTATTRTSEGALYVEAAERIAAETHLRAIVVTSLVAVA